MKRTAIRRSNIRTLRPGEEIPQGEPRRYKSSHGYVRLRWKVGVAQYVETYEHRVVAGLPADQVHHRDEDKTNNDPTNLEVLTAVEHAKRHAAEQAAASKRLNLWGGLRSQSAYDDRQRSLARKAKLQERNGEIVRLYRSGLSTIAVGEALSLHHSQVSRILRSAGVIPSKGTTTPGRRVAPTTKTVVQARARMRCELCGRNLSYEVGHIHHRLPRGMGGSRAPERHEPQNLLFLCVTCHQSVESRRAEALAAGWLVLSCSDPAQVPVLVEHGSRWAYLTSDGRYSDTPDGE